MSRVGFDELIIADVRVSLSLFLSFSLSWDKCNSLSRLSMQIDQSKTMDLCSTVIVQFIRAHAAYE